MYVAGIDLKTKQVQPRRFGEQLDGDLTAPWPVSAALVRAPLADGKHVLMSECHRAQSAAFRAHVPGGGSGFTFVADPPATNVTYCQLLSWDPFADYAKSVAPSVYANPAQFYAVPGSAHYLGRQLNGTVREGDWKAGTHHWQTVKLGPADTISPEAVGGAGGSTQLYDSRYDTIAVDQWLTRMNLAIADFLTAPLDRHGYIDVQPLSPRDTRTPGAGNDAP